MKQQLTETPTQNGSQQSPRLQAGEDVTIALRFTLGDDVVNLVAERHNPMAFSYPSTIIEVAETHVSVHSSHHLPLDYGRAVFLSRIDAIFAGWPAKSSAARVQTSISDRAGRSA